MIIALPAILAQLTATYIFYNRHWDSISRNMSDSITRDIKVTYELKLNNIDPKLYEKLITKVQVSDFISKEHIKEYHPPEFKIFYDSLKAQFPLPIQIGYIDNGRLKVDIFETIKNKKWSFIITRKRVYSSTSYIFIALMAGTNLLFLILSIIFTRKQIRPIIKLARAADKFGKGQNIILKPEGAKEIRRAAQAFLKMQTRITRQFSYRTEMLAGVSHDLRTPLTRMKLQLAITKDPELGQMFGDIQDMEQMINSYLDFARNDTQEDLKLVYFQNFLTKIIAPYLQHNHNLSITKHSNIKIALRISNISRCLQNLFDNAFKYGDQAIVNYYKTQEELCIEIHDNGNGIPIDKREAVFKPFFRLEESRNKNTGGVGLGLAVAQDIVTNHGGQINLESSNLLGGLKVIIKLPL